MRIPLANKLKKRLHSETAFLQDEVIDIVYGLEPNAVLHGGTAIWRCYQGNRFSEDLDFYFIIGENLERELTKRIKERNLQLIKYKKTENVVFSKISNNNVEVRLEVNFLPQDKDIVVRPYEKIDGSFIDIFTLSPEQLLVEKINAYNSRRLIRDIYDIHHLIRYQEKKEETNNLLKSFVYKIKKPVDEENLKAIVYTGAIPSFKQILEALKRGI
ncbi:MAG TPA: nucleotidyl transferase AbiEii/AbiGii toxin family protein [Candidatus Bilamarchaeaceae archaeon]|nr:nucleotidyl transferase AbiEii/AbiGii toxin family protein [Candidatus Bilamarchaeaceae archaeon]